MDWQSREVFPRRLANGMDAGFCNEARKEAKTKHGAPEIFNTNYGSQFTRSALIDILTDARVKISMDGKSA